MVKKQFKSRSKRVLIPAVFWDGEQFIPATKYPNCQVFTDSCLAGLLNVSPMRVSMWRKENVIPFEMKGNFAVYRLTDVLSALLAKGYTQSGRSKGGLL